MDVDVLLFDVFGTVVDWRSSVSEKARSISQETGVPFDAEVLAARWRERQRALLADVADGRRDWLRFDALNRLALHDTLTDLGLESMDRQRRDALVSSWAHLAPFPDSVEGLARLRRTFVTSVLSNGNHSLLVELSRFAGLQWDSILSTEIAHTYKPDPVVYQTALTLLDVPANAAMMVAAHAYDLRAAARLGMRTAFVKRPGEEIAPKEGVDLFVDDLIELVEALPS